MSQVGSCGRNHSQMAKRFSEDTVRCFCKLFIGRGLRGRESGNGDRSFWVYDSAFILWATEKESVCLFRCECEWPGADLSWATPRVSHPRKLTWPWVGCPGKAQASGTCYPVPHGIHTSHIGRRGFHTLTHTHTHTPKTWYIKHAHTSADVHSLKCSPLSPPLFLSDTHAQKHTLFAHIHRILRNPQRGKEGLARGRERRKKWRLLYSGHS